MPLKQIMKKKNLRLFEKCISGLYSQRTIILNLFTIISIVKIRKIVYLLIKNIKEKLKQFNNN